VRRPARASRKIQDSLIERHLPLARSLAQSAYHRLPNHPLEDILGSAMLGLVDAARKFRPGMHVPFECYARLRISGSIVDAHRALHRNVYVTDVDVPEPLDDGEWFQKQVGDEMLARSLRPVLRLLSTFELKIVRMKYGQNLALKEIARRLDVSDCSVATTHKRVLDMLRFRLARFVHDSVCA
jgi:RNA polymerase sigma factor (sigma-70 family)